MSAALRLAAALLLVLAGCGGEVPEASGIEVVRAAVAKALPASSSASVRQVAEGLYEVRDGAAIAYVTADGQHLIKGDVVKIADAQNLTEDVRKAGRLARLAELGSEDTIVFAPAGPARHVVTVFTDIDCGFCRKLHEQVAAYNAAGIEIRYLAFPRAGPDTESFRKAQSVWCAADPQQALTRANRDLPVQAAEGCAAIVRRAWDLGNDFQLPGTPLLVLEDGSLVSGYLTPEQLAQRLESPPRPVLAL